MKILHIVPWAADRQVHGGTRRTAQIIQWLASEPDADVVRWVAQSTVTDWPDAAIGAWHLKSGVATALRGRMGWRGRLKLVRLGFALAAILQRVKPDLVVLETAPSRSLLVGQLLAGLSIPYIVAPHNVESLVPGPVLRDYQSRGALLDIEAEVVSQAKACIAISALDQGIYQAMGARAVLYPYFPTDAELARFERVRGARAQAVKSGLLVLGSVSNQPTLAGMRGIVAELARASPFPAEPVHVAGYRTEVLRDCASAAVQVHGTVSDAELDALLSQSRCVVLQQPFTSGGLTRLVELNLCGIPVVITGSYLQARGLESHGIHACDRVPQAQAFYQALDRQVHQRYLRPQLALLDLV